MTPTRTEIKVSIPGFIHRFAEANPELEPRFTFWPWKDYDSSWVMIQPYTIELSVPDDRDVLIQGAVANIQAEQQEALDDYLRRKVILDQKIANLLALSAPKAFSPDSEGGAEDLEGDFAPDETSFG